MRGSCVSHAYLVTHNVFTLLFLSHTLIRTRINSLQTFDRRGYWEHSSWRRPGRSAACSALCVYTGKHFTGSLVCTLFENLGKPSLPVNRCSTLLRKCLRDPWKSIFHSKVKSIPEWSMVLSFRACKGFWRLLNLSFLAHGYNFSRFKDCCFCILFASITLKRKFLYTLYLGAKPERMGEGLFFIELIQ